MHSQFVTVAFGGPNNYSGQAMNKCHARVRKLGLTVRDFVTVYICAMRRYARGSFSNIGAGAGLRYGRFIFETHQ